MTRATSVFEFSFRIRIQTPPLRTRSSAGSAVRCSRASRLQAAASGPQYAPIPRTPSSSSVPPRELRRRNVFDAWFSGLANRVGMVPREDDRPEAIGSRGGLGDAEFGTQRSAHARSVAGTGARGAADMRDASNSERPCVTSSRNEKTLATANNGIHRPIGGAPGSGGNVPAAVRSRVALSRRRSPRASTCSAASVPTVPVLGAS